MAPNNFQSNQQGDSDLYAQIAAGDEVESHENKTKSSFMMTMMIAYMRLTLLIDAKRREYQKVFHTLRMIWAGAMGILYLCGLVMFLILVAAYARFPSYVRSYLDENGISYSKVDIPGYVVSKIDLYGLHDKENLYRIEKVSLSSTFADFVNHRARKMDVKGVNLVFDTEEDIDKGLISRFVQIGKATESLTGAQVDSIDISDVTLTIKGKDYTLPVHMTILGSYGKETNMSASIDIHDPILKATGVLLIKNEKGGMSWDLDIQNGTFSFPNQPPEELKGKVKLTTKGAVVKDISADFALQFEQIRKSISLKAEREKNLYDGNLRLVWTDFTDTFKPVDRTNITLGFKGLSASIKGDIQTQEPIQLDLSTKFSSDVQVEKLSAELIGKLTCRLLDSCQYDLTQPSSLEAGLLFFPIRAGSVQNSMPVRLKIGKAQKAINILFKDGKIVYNLPIMQPFFRGKLVDSKGIVVFTATNGNVSGEFDLWDKNMTLGVSLKAVNYETPTLEIKNGTFEMDNIFADNGNFYLQSPKVLLKDTRRLKQPFFVDYTRKGGKSDVILTTEDKQIQLLFGGYLDLASGQLDGQLVIPTVNLGKVKQPLNQISDILPSNFVSILGTVSAYGRVSGNVFSDLKGPLYLGLENVDIKTEEMDLKGLNAALLLQSIYPLTTETDQRIYFKQIKSFLPVSNIDMLIRIGDQFAQLKSLTATVAGVPLVAEESVVPYENVRTLVYLKSKETDLKKITDFIRLKDWKLAGKLAGTILLPVEIKNMTVNLKSAVLQLANATLVYSGTDFDKPKELGKDTQIDIRSGNVTIDTISDSKDKLKLSIALDTILKPSGLKKLFRETLTGNLSEMVYFTSMEGKEVVPPEIKKQLQQIKEQTKAFRVVQ